MVMTSLDYLCTTAVSYSCFLRNANRKYSSLLHGKYGVFLFDIVVGLLLFRAFQPNETFADELTFRTEDFIAWLQSLIEWLMGNPAGLKLNKPLNIAVGNFFLYHIYLWKTYITFLKPALLYSLIVLRYTSLFGLTLMFALGNDMFSFLTVHIFCFYVYAARLYQLQITGVISLWRLFRGKKYNPFRDRVDSAEFDQQQLFLGTLVFTVLLFLLPTILVYYSVFTFLRVVVYLCQTFVDECLRIVNKNDTDEAMKFKHFVDCICDLTSSVFSGRLL